MIPLCMQLGCKRWTGQPLRSHITTRASYVWALMATASSSMLYAHEHFFRPLSRPTSAPTVVCIYIYIYLYIHSRICICFCICVCQSI